MTQQRDDAVVVTPAHSHLEAQLHEARRRFRVVFDLSPLAMGLTRGETGTYSEVNDALCELLGRDADELIGMSAADILHPDDVHLADPAGAAARAAPDGRGQVEMRLIRKDGAVLHALVTLAWIDAGDGVPYLLAQMEDITARRAAEAMLRHQADSDALTGLANRAHLARVLADLARRRARVAALFVDLDGFKIINDTRGHDVGDQVLVEVARRIAARMGPDDLVARFGGDEFVVLLGGDDPSDAAADVQASRITEALVRPVETDAGPVRVTASIGLSVDHVELHDPMAPVQQADAAMYRAKSLGKNRSQTYGPLLHRQTMHYRRTEMSLRSALSDDRFQVHYQPIVELGSSAVVGLEALVRLIDEHGVLVPPSDFIAVAEQSGLIVPLGAWVLQEGCRTLAQLREQTGRDLRLSVNVSPCQASRPDLIETVLDALDRSTLPEHLLSLELTESALLNADDLTLGQLVELRDRGLGISLDDFGTGYSSLTHLRRFPVTQIKIDRSFVAGMVTSPSDHAIVSAVTRLAHDLGMGWVAEGIETSAQHRAVSSLGPGLGQGYLFGRPVPVEVLRARLTDSSADCSTA